MQFTNEPARPPPKRPWEDGASSASSPAGGVNGSEQSVPAMGGVGNTGQGKELGGEVSCFCALRISFLFLFFLRLSSFTWGFRICFVAFIDSTAAIIA